MKHTKSMILLMLSLTATSTSIAGKISYCFKAACLGWLIVSANMMGSGAFERGSDTLIQYENSAFQSVEIEMVAIDRTGGEQPKFYRTEQKLGAEEGQAVLVPNFPLDGMQELEINAYFKDDDKTCHAKAVRGSSSTTICPDYTVEVEHFIDSNSLKIRTNKEKSTKA